MSKKINKKCISPVVAVALLLVVAVFAVVNFQGWYNEYATSIFADSENKDNIGLVDVNDLIGETLYVKYTGTDNISIRKIKIGDNECNLTNVDNLTTGISEINISSCIKNSNKGEKKIIIVTDKKVTEKTFYLENNIYSSSLSCITDADEDGYLAYTCAVYPMTETSYEGILDPDDTYDSTGIDFTCYLKGNKSSCVDNFIVDECGSGTVLDTGTGLCWQRNMSTAGTKTWADAKTYCDGLSLGGHSDWYLPSKEELMTLTDLSRYNPAIVGGNNNKFQNVQSSYYWTVSTYGPSTSSAWYVGFSSGTDVSYAKANAYYVVCVR